MKPHRKNTRRPNRSLLACALASCLVVAAPQVMAQSASANLRGQVTGAEAATTVTATNLADGSVRRTTTNASGSYTLVGLPPGTYRVDAGGSPQTVQLSVASSATLNLQAAGGVAETATGGDATTLETISVVGVQLQEVKTSEVGESISLRQIQTVPQSSRNFLEFADSVPGMVFERDANGRTSLKGGAQNSNGVNLYIDGVGQKSYVKKGGVSGQFDSAGNPFPQLAIGEYKVITSNYKAEYGQISSAAVTAVTRSGGNDLEGEIFYRITNEGLREKTPSEEATGADKMESQEEEFGFAVGGPLIQDRAHFFVTMEKKEFALPTTVFPGAEVPPATLDQLPGDVRAQFGPAIQPFDELLAFAKVDWNVTDDDRIALSAQRRNEETVSNIGNQTAPSSGIFTDNYDNRYSLRWEHSSDRFFNEVLATTEEAFNNPVPLNYGNGFIYTTPVGTNDPTMIRVGAADPRAGQVKGQEGWSLEDNLTLNSIEWMGDHTIKMGARYKSVDLFAADALNANPQFLYLVGGSFDPSQPYQAVFAKPVTGVGSIAPSVETTAKQIGLYIQDDWQVNDKLTLNLGIRWDYEEVPAYLDFVTPQNVIDAFNGQDPNAPAGQSYRQSLLNGGVDIDDYISTGNNRDAFKDAWQPRLGFSYDMNADEKHVIHGGAGRSYDRNVYDFLQLEVTKSALPQLTINFRDPVTGTCYRDRTPCFDWDPSYLDGIENLQALVAASNQGVEVDLMHNDLKTPYSDQYSIGMSNQLGDWLTDATVTRVISKDGFAFNLGNRYPNGDFFQNGGQPWGNGVPGFGALILGNNGIETRSTQLLLSASKAYTRESGWGTTLAYTFTDAEQNRDINEHYSFDAATMAGYPFLASNSVPRHRFVATGSYDAFWDITFGGKLVLETPRYFYGSQCLASPPTASDVPTCVPDAARPDDTFGYRSLDLQASKDFKVDVLTFYVRADILNVFNWDNFSSAVVGVQDGSFQARYNETGTITGSTRTFKFSFGMKF